MWIALVASALTATFPTTERLPGIDPVAVRPFLRRLQREAPAAIRWAMYATALVFHLTPLLTVGIPLPAFLLPQRLRDRHAHKLATSRWFLLRQSMLMVKTIGGLHWGADPEVRKRLSLKAYPPDPGTWRPTC